MSRMKKMFILAFVAVASAQQSPPQPNMRFRASSKGEQLRSRFNKTTGNTDITFNRTTLLDVAYDKSNSRVKISQYELNKNLTLVNFCSDKEADEHGGGLAWQYSIAPFFGRPVCNAFTVNPMGDCMMKLLIIGEDNQPKLFDIVVLTALDETHACCRP